ncbi:YebC/PmpR family DNA-binding transcriptional regulator [Candidatus Microgenomates bacterium]|jgi:YebC/PmpR family DNA-binding regulatory protein|nr:MAG: YebC/PmpR family DNA-binding transcriptional regulator [Candidatus Microgenomates bacterium]
MSGHSKWATIHRQKEVSDQKRGQVFTKISNAIIIAVRESGGITDPNHNFKLRLVLEKARAANMPKDNVQRAIDRAAGKGEGDGFTEVTYEGYGPGGVGILVETATDNKQRTVQEVKNIFDKAGGSVASPGSVAFNFEKKGLITVEAKEGKDELILRLIDIGAEDVEEAGELLEIYVHPDNLMVFKDKLTAEGIEPKSVELVMKPVNMMPINDTKTAQQVMGLIEKLESLDDVQKVYANFDFPEEMLSKLQ